MDGMGAESVGFATRKSDQNPSVEASNVKPDGPSAQEAYLSLTDSVFRVML